MYYDLNKILSYNSFLNVIIGERGSGKTYSTSKFVTKKFITNSDEFVYIRRYKSDLKKSIPKFFTALINNNEFPDHTLSYKGDNFIIDDKVAGYAITLTMAQSLKSTNFPNVKYIIFDEFILENDGHRHYLQNEVEVFLGLVETIARMRDVKIFLLGNAVTITNPYFIFFDISLPYICFRFHSLFAPPENNSSLQVREHPCSNRALPFFLPLRYIPHRSFV